MRTHQRGAPESRRDRRAGSVGSFPWADVPGYVAARWRTFIGAALVWLTCRTGPSRRRKELKLRSSAPRPGDRRPRRQHRHGSRRHGDAPLWCPGYRCRREAFARPGDVNLAVVFSGGLQPLLVGLLVLSIGLSLGGPTGYAINPARDFGPRLAHALLPIAGKGDSTVEGLARIPIAGPLIGGVSARCCSNSSGSSQRTTFQQEIRRP